MHRRSPSHALLSLLLTLSLGFASACSDREDDPQNSDDAGTTSAENDAGTGDTGANAGGDAGVVAIDCPEPTGGPTIHSGYVDEDETWTAAASPHIVDWSMRVLSNATLTIEPCAKVVFRKDRGLDVMQEGARLIAEGTPTRPIRFEGENGEFWGPLTIQHPGSAILRHVRFSHGGAEGFTQHATIAIRGDQTTPAKAPVLLDHVLIENSMGPGVVLTRAAAFAPGSRELVIKGAGIEGIPVPFPVVISEHAIDSLPSGSYTGNRVDEILIDPEGANGQSGLQEDATMRDPGVPYRIGTWSGDKLIISERADGGTTTLTIEPGVVLRFTEGSRFEVLHWTGDEPAGAVLVAVGTPEKPIVFTSAAAEPKKGDWTGLWYGGVARAENRLEHVVLEYTGYDCGCVLLSCSNIPEFESAIIFSQMPLADFIHNVHIRHGSGHGILRSWRGGGPDFTATNTFEDLDGCVQTLPYPVNGGCPNPRPACE